MERELFIALVTSAASASTLPLAGRSHVDRYGLSLHSPSAPLDAIGAHAVRRFAKSAISGGRDTQRETSEKTNKQWRLTASRQWLRSGRRRSGTIDGERAQGACLYELVKRLADMCRSWRAIRRRTRRGSTQRYAFTRR